MSGTYACLTDAQWNLVEDKIPQEGSSKGGRPAGDVRLFLDCLLWIAKTGSPWRALQDTVFGNWKTMYSRMRRWEKKDMLRPVFEAFMECGLIDTSVQMADGTFNRALKAAAGANKKTSGGQDQQGLGRCKGGFATKIHVIVDANGLPILYTIDGGQVNDIINAYEVADKIHNCIFLADKAYDCDKLIHQLEEQGCKVIIPSKKNRKNPRDLDEKEYKKRRHIAMTGLVFLNLLWRM